MLWGSFGSQLAYLVAKCQMFPFLQDVNCEKVFIGVSNVGVTIYRGNRLMSTFVW